MTTNDKLNGSEQPMNETPLSGVNGIVADAIEAPGGGLLRSRWALLAMRRRRLLICSGVSALLAVFILTEFVMHKKYQAQAVIRPNSQDQNGLSGLLQSTGLMSNSNLGNGITGPPDPNELVAILQSYAFTTSMLRDEHLTPKLLKGSYSLSSLIPFLKHEPPSEYSMYRLMSGRFDCDFSIRTGNMSLSFIDKNSDLAQKILGFYISRLRDQIRDQTVRDTKAALHSLEAEATKTTDPLVRDQVYQLIGMQIQQVKTAEANSDFAFTVIEPPFVPPLPYAPWVIFDSLAAGLLVTLMVFAAVAVSDSVPKIRRELAGMIAATERPQEEEIPAAKRRRPARLPQGQEHSPDL